MELNSKIADIRDLLTKSVVCLFVEERFYAELILRMDRKINRSLPTAGVCVKKGKVELHINPEFFSGLSLNEQIAILKHECKHILNNHIHRSMQLAPEVYTKDKTKDQVEQVLSQMKHRVINMATDCAINPGIPNIPEWGCFPKNFNLKDGETMEWYVENLKNNEKAKDFNNVDDHAIWAESDDDKEALNARIKKLINDAAKTTRGAGFMTSEDELLVSKINASVVDWKSILKRFVSRQIESVLESSKKKRNRRYGIMFPGQIKIETLHIGVAIDTSGSVSNDQLSQFMSEICNISKYAKITVVEADSEIKNIYDFDPKKTYSVKGRGGTAYAPAIEYFSEKTDVDAVIYFGDMDTSDEKDLVKPKYPVLWAIVGHQNPPVDWGSQVRIEFKEKR